jgi:hypothetical protein
MIGVAHRNGRVYIRANRCIGFSTNLPDSLIPAWHDFKSQKQRYGMADKNNFDFRFTEQLMACHSRVIHPKACELSFLGKADTAILSL